jgi:diaminopimelate decarboxylase
MMSQGIWNNKSELARAATQFGTPFYCYDSSILEETFRSLRKVLSKNVDIFYSIKANPNIALCDELRQLGACAELCSYYEILAAIKTGFDPKNIIFVGPAKLDKEIHKCLELGVYAIICESIEEFKRISKLAGQRGQVARVALRINPSHISKSALLKMGGKPSQFGMDEEIVFANKDFFLKMPHIKLVGIHIYNGTRILNADTIIENSAYILNLARILQQEWNQVFEMVDIGGGLGVPYFDNEETLDLEKLKSGMAHVIQAYINDFPHTRIILESGRYLVATAGVLISCVLDIKPSKGELFVITDGGTNCHMAAVGIGSFVKRNFPISAICIKENNDESSCQYNVTGPLCTPGDLIGKQVLLPQLSIGDFVLVKNSGAYGPTASPVMFLSHGFPAEVLFKHNTFHLIRDRFTEHEFIDKQYLIN